VFLIDQILLVGGVLLLIGIVSSKFATRLGLPVLVLFIVVGMLAGEEGIGGIAFENYALAHGIGTVALGVILFDGGLRTRFGAFRVAWKPSALLATLGVLITSFVTVVAAAWAGPWPDDWPDDSVVWRANKIGAQNPIPDSAPEATAMPMTSARPSFTTRSARTFSGWVSQSHWAPRLPPISSSTVETTLSAPRGGRPPAPGGGATNLLRASPRDWRLEWRSGRAWQWRQGAATGSAPRPRLPVPRNPPPAGRG
jgi:hypothetical protein